MKLSYFLILSILISFGKVNAQMVSQGKGSYNLTLPPDDYPSGNQAENTFDVIGDGTTGYSFVTKGPNYKGPFQSHQWWTSALWNVKRGEGKDGDGEVSYRGDSHSGRMTADPLIITANPNGFAISYRDNANITSGPDDINNGPALTHLQIGFIGEAATATSVDGYGDWHAIFRQEWNGDVLTATAAKGNPYLFLQRQGNTNFTFFYQGNPATINAIFSDANMDALSITVKPLSSGKANVSLGIFLPKGSTLGGISIPSLTVGAAAPFGSNFEVDIPAGKNFFSVAVLPSNSQNALDLFAQHAFNFISNTEHSYVFNPATSKLATTFKTTTSNVYGLPDNGTLQALYRHQWLYSTQAAGSSMQYNSPRGVMKLIANNTFTTVMDNQGILPNLGWANNGSKTTLKTFVDNYVATLNPIPTVPDGYAKDGFEDLITNVQIAQQIGDLTARDKCLAELKSRLTDWLEAPDNESGFNRYFAYSPIFNHMSHYPNGFGSSGTLVDGHFHVGYFVMAAAILARYDPTFVNDYKPMVATMIRSINNYSKDMTDPGSNGTTSPWFPYLKYFDPYAGFSSSGADGNGEESVSEAMQFASGVFLWGEAVHDNTLRDLGALLYITEGEAGRQYWFDVDKSVNGPPFANAYKWRHITRATDYGGTHNSFLGNDPVAGYSNDYLPWSGASTWIGTNFAGAASEYADLKLSYPNYPAAALPLGVDIVPQQAFTNPSAAVAAFDTYKTSLNWTPKKYAFDYQWLHTFDSCGAYIGAKIHADITGYGLFQKDSCKTWYRHYMIYNPPGSPTRTVHFTDGTCWFLPLDTVITYALLGPDSTGPLTADKSSFCLGQTFKLNYHNFKVCDKDTSMEYQVSRDGTNWSRLFRVSSGGDSLTVTVKPPALGKYYYRVVMLNEYQKTKGLLCTLNDSGKVAMQAVVQVTGCGCDTVGNITLSTKSACVGNSMSLSTSQYKVNSLDTVVEFQQSTDRKNWSPIKRIGPLSFNLNNNVSFTVTKSGWNYFRTVMINAPTNNCKNDTAKFAIPGQVDSAFVNLSVEVNAGPSGKICNAVTYQITDADSLNVKNIIWGSKGDGTFDNAQALLPIYKPGPGDFASGVVKLYITGKSKSNCPDRSDTISVVLSKISVKNAITNASCAVANGAVTIAADGGRGPYTYSFEGGAFGSAATFNNLAINNYTVLVKDANNCQFPDYFGIASKGDPKISKVDTSRLSCNGAGDGKINIQAVGALPPFSYSIDNGSSYQAVAIFSNLPAGFYKIKIKDNTGCLDAAIAELKQPDLLTLAEMTSSHKESCTGVANGAAEIIASGGNSGYEFSTDKLTYTSSSQFTALAPGNLIIYSKDSKGCKDSISVLIAGAPEKAIAGTSTFTCTSSYNLKANTPGPGKGRGLWAVVSGQGSLVNPSLPQSTVKNLLSGTSTKLKWTISNGICGSSAPSFVSISAIKVGPIHLGHDSILCPKDSILIHGGSDTRTYVWNGVLGDPDHYVTKPGKYIVEVTEKGCTAKDSITFIEECPASIYLPSAFSPNGDGLNDTFTAYGSSITKFEMSILNRWGERFYLTDDIGKPWDGKTTAGLPAPSDVYIYYVNYTFMIDKRLKSGSQNGRVTLIR